MLPLIVSLLAAAPAAVKPIDGAEIRGHIRFLASDLLEGRAPGSTGDLLAQEYISTQFETLGLEPGAPDGGWIQPVELVGVTSTPKTITIAGKTPLTFETEKDFIAVSGTEQTTTTIEKAPLIFVGYGIQAPEYQWDDFKGVDVKGKVLVVMNNDPEDDPKLFAGKTRLWYGRWDYKYEQARKLGAAGCLIIHTTPSAGYPWPVVVSSWSGEQFDLPVVAGQQTIAMKGFLTETATRRLVALSGKDLDALRKSANSRSFKPVPLDSSLSMTFPSAVAKKKSANVLGLLRGADPQLKSEAVVFTAHHDHLGKKDVGAQSNEDLIYNGAVDNASGVAAMLAIARYMTSLPQKPKRSILFAAVAAEEAGLFGSQVLIEHPPFPPAKIAADVNIDGLNFLGRTRDVSVIGLGKSSIDSLIVQHAKAQNRVVKPDALTDRGFFYRSDQFNFAKYGVPSAYFSSGQDFIGKPDGWGKQQRETWEEKHYHQPSDEVRSDWVMSGAVDDVTLFFEVGWSIANAPEMPTWTKGDEFESVRLRSLP